MELKELAIPGVYLIENFVFRDDRGFFVKTFHKEQFAEKGIDAAFTESYYTQSNKNVVRGMHFQLPPFDYDKMVYVTEGKILDVILDLRKDSPAYGNFVTLELTAFGNSVFVPRGCAHGFLALSEVATLVYNVSVVYHPEYDQGILWNSFGFDWPVEKPLLSPRDLSFAAFDKSKPLF